MTVYRSSREESREFWRGVDEAVAEVATWPEWMIDHPAERTVTGEVDCSQAPADDDSAQR